jgi:glycosyltransferase involved in cell wall biosynthesis
MQRYCHGHALSRGAPHSDGIHHTVGSERRPVGIAVRIAQVLPAGAHPYSGVPVVVVQLAVHLARRGHDVEVWLLQPWTSEEAAPHGPALRDAGVTVVAAPARGRGRLAALAGRDVQIAHLHSVFTPPNALLARRLRVPYVVSPHGGYAPAALRRGSVRKALYRLLVERQHVGHAALRVALTEVEARDLVAFGAHGPIVVIPNGATPPSREGNSAAFRQELGLGPHRRLLLFVGRLDVVHKGLDDLVRGLSAAPGWHLALVGSDFRGGAEQLRRLSRDLGAEARLTLAGPRHGRALQEAFAAADCFALMSRWEGLPISLLEALSYGLPAIVSPSVDELVGVAEVGAGWAVRPAELGALLRDLRHLDGDEQARRSSAARALATRYDWPTVALRYEAAYAEVLDRMLR